MVAVAAIVVAIARCAWRDLRGIGAFAGNNMFAVIALLMAEEPLNRPSSTAVFYLFIGLLYALPMAWQMTARIPPARFQLWPLSRAQRALLYVLNLVFNPMILVAALFAALSRHSIVGVSLLVAGLAAPFLAILFRLVKWPARLDLLSWIPRFPGKLGGLIQNHLRELLQTLDPYLAALLATGGMAYRIYVPHIDPMATFVLGHIVVILMSTLAQGHISFDPLADRTRSRLMPVKGVEVLLAKDAAWLIVVLVLIASYPVIACAGAALLALAIGHETAVRKPVEQIRWNFSTGRLGPTGIFQIIAIMLGGSATHQFGPVMLIPFAATYAASLWWFGRKWDELAA